MGVDGRRAELHGWQGAPPPPHLAETAERRDAIGINDSRARGLPALLPRQPAAAVHQDVLTLAAGGVANPLWRAGGGGACRVTITA